MTDQRTLKNIITEQRKQINTMILQRKEANRIFDEIPEPVGAHLPSQNDLQIIYHQEELRQWRLRLQKCLSQEPTKEGT
jgi:hypothetical protein